MVDLVEDDNWEAWQQCNGSVIMQWLSNNAIRLSIKHWEGGEEGEDFRIACLLQENGNIYIILSLKILFWEFNQWPYEKHQ